MDWNNDHGLYVLSIQSSRRCYIGFSLRNLQFIALLDILEMYSASSLAYMNVLSEHIAYISSGILIGDATGTMYSRPNYSRKSNRTARASCTL